MRFPNERVIPIVGLSIAILALLGIGVFSYKNIRKHTTDARRVVHTLSVINELEGILTGVAEAESSLRGFALSHDPRFLRTHGPALRDISQSFKRVRVLLRHDSVHKTALDALEAKLDARLATFKAHLRSVYEHPTEDITVPIQALTLTSQIRTLIREMSNIETHRLKTHSLRTAQQSERTTLTLGFGTLASIVLLLVAFARLNSEIRWRALVQHDLNEKKNLLEAIIGGTSDTIYIKDLQGKYLLINSAGAQALGKAPMDIIGKDDRELMSAETARAVMAQDFTVMHSAEPQTVEETVRVDGVTRVYLSMKAPYRGPHKEVIGLIGISRDVTERRRTEETRVREITFLLEMGEMLQACRTVEESYEVMTQLGPHFFQEQSGAMCLIHASKNIVESQVQWGDAPTLSSSLSFRPEECWSLRRGQPHMYEAGGVHVLCKHITQPISGHSSLCLPLVAHGELLGIFHLVSRGQMPPEIVRRATVVGEQFSMALANLRLRETLRNQSIRDPLTGLFNRRYTEETLDREIRRAEREQSELSVLMLDVDHFKDFNDRFGHAAGDHVLRSLGGILNAQTRGSDIASRMGGEEFLILLPGSGVMHAQQKAEQLRAALHTLDLQHIGRSVGRVTASIGLATYPIHGMSAETLIQAADDALYRAKHAGRDRVAVA